MLLTLDLWQRGQAQGSCPINSLFDVLVFMSWSILLIYLLVGPAYHLSLLGAFTSPLVFLVLLFAQLGAGRSPRPGPVFARDPWVEAHAALSLIAYGAFALAAVAGLMYLVQDRQLKKRQAGTLFYNLPPVTELGVANARLLWLGFGVLTVGFAAGFMSDLQGEQLKFATSVLIWIGYVSSWHCAKPIGFPPGGQRMLRWLFWSDPPRAADHSIPFPPNEHRLCGDQPSECDRGHPGKVCGGSPGTPTGRSRAFATLMVLRVP